eukprot:10960949-Karenia_brevis.AAC.1
MTFTNNLGNEKKGLDVTMYVPERVQIAREKYAETYSLKVEDVSIEQIIKSKQGFVFWAMKDEKMNARSSLSQQFNRALNWNKKWLNLYPNFIDSVKINFRKNFCVCKSFAFTEEER